MPGNRQLTYTVVIDTSSARQQAAAMRAQFENELKQIKVGSIAAPRSVGDGGAGGLASGADAANRAFTGLNKTLGVFGVALGVQQLYQFTVGVGQLGTEVARAEVAFNQMSGGAEKAQANVRAIQAAAGGTVSSFDALKIGVQAAALSLAQTSEEFAQITRAGRAVAIVSPVINDVGSAISELGLAAANLSFRRLDQLGLSVSEVRDGMARLKSETQGLDDSQLFLRASVEALESKYGDLLNSTEAQATGFERLGVAIAEARRAAAEGAIGASIQGGANFLADSFNELNVILSGTKAEASVIEEALKSVTDAYQNQSNILQNTPLFGDALKKDRLQIVGQLQEVGQIFSLATDALADDPSLIGYQQQIKEIVVDVTKWGYATDLQISTLRRLYDELVKQQSINAPSLQAQSAEEAAKALAEQRAASIAEQQTGVNDSLGASAAKSVSTLGLEQTIELLKQQKAQVDAAITDLINSSVTDPSEISLRVAEIQQAAQQAFADAVANAPVMPEIDPGITAGSFDLISQSLADLNTGFVDFLPNMAAARDELIALQTEVALTGITTQEQADALDYLSGAALAVADDTGILVEVTNDLGIAFLAANPEAAGIVDAMYSAQASYLSGAITAEQYAGILSVLGGQLLTLASQAGVATGSILQLIAAQGGLAGGAGFAQGQTIGGGVASRLKTQEDARARTEARKAAAQAAREAEAAAKRAAREQESSAKRAGKALESAAKKAADELKSALKSVPGLFGRSSVTKEQMDLASQGVPQNFADDYLRRLQDEVFNNKDWADVSIEEAKAALAKIGVTASDNNKAAFEQFAQAWESSALFADKENLSFINQEAVKLQLDLQEKAKQGQANIYELFGIAVDEAVESVAGGIGGGASVGGAGAAGGVTIPITGELIAMNGANGTAAGGGTFAITPTIDTLAIQDQLNLLTLPEFQITAMGMADLQAQLDGITSKVVITATLADTAGTDISSSLADQLATQIETFKSQGGTIGTIVKDGLAQSFNAIEGDQVVSTELADAIIGSIGAQLGAKIQSLRGIGAGVGDIIRTSIAADMGTVQWQDGEIVAPIASGLVTAISTQVRGTTDAFRREGSSVAQIVMSGLSAGFSGVSAEGIQSADLAFVLAGNINTQFSTNANFFYAAGQLPAQNVISGYRGYFSTDSNEGAPLVTPMVTAINTQIRTKAEDLKNQGITIAQYVQSGVSIGFNSESFKSALIAVGESLYANIRTGLIRAADGGDLVESLGAKILADISGTVEAAE